MSYYCERRDPEFDAKMHDVLVIYKQIEMQFDKDGKLIPFEKDAVHTLSYDEKPGIQAIATTGEDHPPIPNTDKSNGYQRDYEYVRLGTLSLLAAIDLLSGEAIPLVSETHKSSDFVTLASYLFYRNAGSVSACKFRSHFYPTVLYIKGCSKAHLHQKA